MEIHQLPVESVKTYPGSLSIGKGKCLLESQQQSLKTSWKTPVLQGVEEGIREGIADLFWGVVSKSGGTSWWDWGNEICQRANHR